MARVYIAIDKSGSMQPYIEGTIKGVSDIIRQQAEDTSFTINTFNHKISTIANSVRRNDVRPLTKLNYRPAGGTALMDAIGFTIEMAEADEPSRWADRDDDSTITIVIMTDGAEWDSVKYSADQIKDIIENKKMNMWKFVFMGASEETITCADSIGIDHRETLHFDTNVIDSAFNSAGTAIARMISSNSYSVEFSDNERMASQSSAF